MHPLVDAILSTGTTRTPDGRVLPVHSHNCREECDLLYRLAATLKPRVAVEVGMAFGLSTVCLCDALRQAANGAAVRLISMDPAQHDATWQGLGLHHVAEAGLSDVLEFHERTSQQVLPELVAGGTRAELAFLDGYHTFDHTLVDFFYLDQLLTPGGAIVFDDVGYPAINAVVRFVLSNRDYEILERVVDPGAPSLTGVKHTLKRVLRRLGRTDQTPTDEHQQLFDRLRGAQAIALRKRGNDCRRFDHFVSF